MLKENVQKALNDQIQGEFHAAYLYLSMSAYCEGENLEGFANWLRKQSEEEIAHAMRLFHYVHNRGGRVLLQPIEGPKAEFSGVREVFEDAYEHEKKVTGMINGLMDLAVRESDYATQAEMQWFVTEQVEEEATAERIVQRIRLADGQPAAILMLDHELGSRQVGE